MNQRIRKLNRGRVRVRCGSTLIDVAVGSMLMASLLIPSLHVMSESQKNTQRLAVRQTLLQTAEQQVETLKVRLSEPSVFASTLIRPLLEDRTVTTSMGIPARVRVQASSDSTVSPGQLLTLTIHAWYDEDQDSRMDTNEIVSTLRTQWARPR